MVQCCITQLKTSQTSYAHSVYSDYTDLQSILYIHIYTHFTNTIKTRRTLTNKQIQVTTGYKQQHEQQEQLIAASAVYQINCACKSTFHRVGT